MKHFAQQKFVLVGILIAFFVAPSTIHAATLFVSPASGTYSLGETFTVVMYVGNATEAINAASGQMSFDNDKLKITSIGYSSSIFKIWAEEPGFSNVAGTMHFSGGLPSPGYTGSAGAIFRVTFQALQEGTANVSFLSGSVLANDGNGTEVMSGSTGANYTITPAKQKPPTPVDQTPTPVKKPPVVSTTNEKLNPPVITEWPDQLEVGQRLVVRGVGNPNGKVVVFFQHANEEAKPLPVTAGADGRFIVTYAESVDAGFYRISAKNISALGVQSGSSDVVTTEVIIPYYLKIGSRLVTYVSIIIGLLALLLLLLIIIIILWLISRKWREHRGIEISQAESILHDGFDQMRVDFHHAMSQIFKSKSETDREKQIEMLEVDFEKELNAVEKEIKKEIEEIKETKKN